MSLKDAERNLRGMGKTIASNTPGPAQLMQGARETARGIWPIWIAIALMYFFGEPFAHWLTHTNAPVVLTKCYGQPPQGEVKCDPEPGHDAR